MDFSNFIHYLPPKLGEVSRESSLNLLCQKENLFIMDNHLALPFAVSRLIHPETSYNYIHIDAHYDALPFNYDEFSELKLRFEDLTLDHYLKLKNRVGKKLIQFDNYFPLFINYYKAQIQNSYFCTHRIGIKPPNILEWEPFELLYKLNELLEQSIPIILNIDIDFFVARGLEKHPLYSNEYMTNLNDLLQKILSNKSNIVAIALSPECSGGWDKSLQIATLLSS